LVTRMSNQNEVKVQLEPEELPKHWYNILPDLPHPLPPPTGPGLANLPKIFPKALLGQEMSQDRYVPIPDELRDLFLYIGRPTPLYRAKRLEAKLNTPAEIYFKREDGSPTGSHKLNTALAQAYYSKKEGYVGQTTETGAGQWGSALALADLLNDMKCTVFMCRSSYLSKPYRRLVMQMYGAEVHPSPSNRTKSGRAYYDKDQNHPGSLGLAISEAIEVALENEGKISYSLGSVLNHVMLHQSIIGQEAKKQFQKIGKVPYALIGCAGGGSNFSGFTFPFLPDKFSKKIDTRIIAVGASEIPKFSKPAPYVYDYGDEAGFTPQLKMLSLGSKFIPPSIYSGGLRYHGYAPILSMLFMEKVIEGRDYSQEYAFECARLFAETEGLIMAPETAHAAAAAIDEAKEAKKHNEKRVIAFNYSGHGLLDLEGYQRVLKLG